MSAVINALLSTGGAPVVWSSPMELKHLDVVRSDIDGELYRIFNNEATPVSVTVGPGNPATAVQAWNTGWRKIDDTDFIGGLQTTVDVGNSPVQSRGIKKYLRSGMLVEAKPSDFPLAPLDAFSIFKDWISCPITDAPAVTTGAAIGGIETVSEGTWAGWCMAVSGATSGVADSTKLWESKDHGKTWYLYGTMGDTTNFNKRIASNGLDRIYMVMMADTTCYRFGRTAGNSSITTAGTHGIAFTSAFSNGCLEYVGRSGSTAATDCLILLTPENMTAGSSNSISVCIDGGSSWNKPSFTPMNAVMKPVMARTNGAGHVLILASSKTTGTPAVQFWANNNQAAGSWVNTFQSSTYHNVSGCCWDGTQYIVALHGSAGVDLFSGKIQGDGSVSFTKISNTNLAAYITGDGSKISGYGIHYFNGQYLLRMTNKISIFPSLAAVCDLTPNSYVPVQGTTVINSLGFSQMSDRCISFNTNVPWSSKHTLGSMTVTKDSTDLVQAMRIQ